MSRTRRSVVAMLGASGLLAVLAAIGGTTAGAAGTSTSTTTMVTRSSLPVQPARQLAEDAQGGCALMRGGNIRCWGANMYGALGDGTTISSSVPVPVRGIYHASAVTSDSTGYCAVIGGGQVACWGANFTDRGQRGLLGNGSDVQFSDLPVIVTGLRNIRSVVGDDGAYGVAAGYCALLHDGGVKCWGINDGAVVGGKPVGSGLLGDGNSKPVSGVPAAVKGLAGPVSSLVSDQAGYCAVLVKGKVECWGDNSYNELGDGRYGGTRSGLPDGQSHSGVATPVTGLARVKTVVSDGFGYCALLVNTKVKCWGAGSYGELGDGGVPGAARDFGSAVPVLVARLANVRDLAGTDYGYCALVLSGKIWCWGYNEYGELGDGRGSTGQAYSDVPVAVRGLATARSLWAGAYTYCAVLGKAGKTVCWGDNSFGLLGAGSRTNSSDVPVGVKKLSRVQVVELASQSGTACALVAGGSTWCWGENFSGGLGAGIVAGNNNGLPAKVVGLGPVPR